MGSECTMSSVARKRAGAAKLKAERELQVTAHAAAAKVPDKKLKAYASRKCVILTLVVVLALSCGLFLTPVSVDPVAHRFSDPRPFENALEINSELRRAKLLFPGELTKPEAFVRDREGYIYTGLGDGRLVHISPDLTNYTTVLRVGQPPYNQCGSPDAEDHCGRILGLYFHPTHPDLLYAADSSFGLLKINTTSRNVENVAPRRRTDEEETPFINFANDVVVLPNGSVFFTDSSKKFARRDVLLEACEGRPNGQLLHFDPTLRQIHVSLDNIYFPNGLSVSHDGSAILFAETTRARIMRYYLSGPKAGCADVFMDNLPGLPDNISPNHRGDGYWVAFAVTRTALLDIMAQLPALRSLIVRLRLVHFVAHSLPKHALIIEVDSEGNILRSFHDKGGHRLQSISHVLDLGDRLLLGSYEAPYAAVLSLNTTQ